MVEPNMPMEGAHTLSNGASNAASPPNPGNAVPRFSIGHMDPAADCRQDFYRYASGKWVDSHPVPADKSRWSAFDELLDRNFRLIHGLLDEASASRRGNGASPRRKVGDFYAAALDRATRTRLGTRPIRTALGQIAAVQGRSGIPSLIARLHRSGVPAVFSAWVAADEKRSARYALYLGQGGIALPDRDYYLLPRFAKIRTAYVGHLRRVFRLAGESPAVATRSARDVLSLETSIARASRSRVDLRDAERNYNRLERRELEARYPRLRWGPYLRAMRAGRAPYAIVGQPDFFERLDELVAKTPMGAWKSYLRWEVLHDSAPHLDPGLEDEDFDFFHRRLLGQETPEPDWKRAALGVDRSLGEALGRLYIEECFPPATVARMNELVQDLHDVVRDRLEKVPWMTGPTRQRALEKFERFTAKVGRPPRFRSYRRVRVSRTDHLGNLWRARAFEVARRWGRVGGKVDRSEWDMTPPTVNAQFDPTKNEILFPAGILQPPFFDPAMDDAVNFGGIAVVIGHEITHGYDDQGRKYDAEGNLSDWWTPEDAREFRARAQRIIDQYAKFEPLPGIPINGELTMGENIADLGGVSLAFEALERRLADGRTPDEPIDGFTPRQRFFLSYGQIWRGQIRDEELRRRLTIDPHSPGRYRVNGVLANLPEFWKAFDVPPGVPMRQPEERRVTIW
ncbi:MAG TPA: M13 family metallopeptidase [Thermoplasmata archaeon]|nr:M13 family metallopeptidase [Thermoplasmata archaeon]